MELISLLRILRRWIWLVVSPMLVTGVALWLRMGSVEPAYEARVKVQLSAPQQEDVAAFDQYRYISLRDEIAVARNNFTEVLQSQDVLDWTVSRLGLKGDDADFPLDVQPVRDADFVYITVGARTAELAAEIANTHLEAAIEYYGVLRALPTNAEKDLFAGQLRVAEEEFLAAEDAFAAFRTENGIASLDGDLATYQAVLEQLYLERDQRMLGGSAGQVDEVDELIAQRQQELDRLTALAPRNKLLEENARQALEEYQLVPDEDTEAALRAAEDAFATFRTENSIASLDDELATYQAVLEQLYLARDQRMLEGSVDRVGEVDRLIAQRQQELNRLTALAPRYNVLEETTRRAREKHQHVLDKYAEAELKVHLVEAASFIQVVEPAQAPLRPAPYPVKRLVLALAGALGFGVLLAFLLEFVFGSKEIGVLPAGAKQGTAPSAGPETTPETVSPTASTGAKAR